MFALLLTLVLPSFAADCAVQCTDLGDCFKQCAGDAEARSCVNPVYDSAGNAIDCTVPSLPVLDSTKGPSISNIEGENCVPNGPRTRVLSDGAAQCPANDIGAHLGLYWSEPVRCDVYSGGRVVASNEGPPRLTFIECYNP